MRDPEELTTAAPHDAPTPAEEKPQVTRIVLDFTEPPSPIRGLLAPPPEVLEIVNRENARLPCSPKYRQLMLDYMSMSYYFGGQWILYRETPQGAEVLAVGRDETRALLRSLPPDQHEGIIGRYCDRWMLPKSTGSR
jgi:hypothetical protein